MFSFEPVAVNDIDLTESSPWSRGTIDVAQFSSCPLSVSLLGVNRDTL